MTLGLGLQNSLRDPVDGHQRMTPIHDFEFESRTRIVFGMDKVDALGELALQIGARRALVVSDPGIVAAGHTGRGIAALEGQGIECHLFDRVQENPTTDNVEDGRAFAKDTAPDIIIGLGGGSSMDCAKGINFLHTNGGHMQDYWGVGKASKPMLPMIAVPTTAGTGSESQSFALISDAQTHQKMACGDKKAAFRIALLDPKLTVTQPQAVTAVTGIDAVAHALETLVTTKKSPVSEALSQEAWLLLNEALPRVLADASDLGARANMQLGACLAGLAIENSMLGAAHALANPLTATQGVVHGQAVGVMLPHVIRFNAAADTEAYASLGLAGGELGARALADRVTEMLALAGLRTRLFELEVDRESLPQLAKQAARQWTGNFNPRPVDEVSLLDIYKEAW